MVTCDIKLFLNYVSVRRRPSEIILFQRVETCLENISKLFRRIIAAHEYFPYHFLVTHRKTHIFKLSLYKCARCLYTSPIKPCFFYFFTLKDLKQTFKCHES